MKRVVTIIVFILLALGWLCCMGAATNAPLRRILWTRPGTYALCVYCNGTNCLTTCAPSFWTTNHSGDVLTFTRLAESNPTKPYVVK